MTAFPAFENIKDNQSINFQPDPQDRTPSRHEAGMKTAASPGEKLCYKLKCESQRKQIPLHLSKTLGEAASWSNLAWLSAILSSDRTVSDGGRLVAKAVTSVGWRGIKETSPPVCASPKTLLWVNFKLHNEMQRVARRSNI